MNKNDIRNFWKVDECIRLKNNRVKLSGVVPEKILAKFKLNVGSCDDLNCLNEFIIQEKYTLFRRPIYTKLPFSYNRIPVNLRNAMFRVLRKNSTPDIFPSWPGDCTADLLKQRYMEILLEDSGGKKVGHIGFWPNRKGFCFCSSHDIESSKGFRHIEDFRTIERTYGIRSVWNVVPFYYKIDFGLLRRIQDEGCEIGMHGYDHSGRMPFMKDTHMDHMLSKGRQWLSTNGIQVNSFRSPQLLVTPQFLQVLSGHFSVDSTIPDTDINAPAALNRGCCTFFPYFIGDLVELPITLPQDFRLIHTKKLSSEEIFNLWKTKADEIIKRGGLVMLLTHPEEYLFGNKEYHETYEKILAYITSKDPWLATPTEISLWWNKRASLRLIDGNITSTVDGLDNTASTDTKKYFDTLEPHIDWFS